MNIRRLLFAGLAFSFVACSEGETDTSNENEVNETEISEETENFQETQEAIIADDPLAELRFDEGGKKWKVNAATDEGMLKIKDILDHFEGDDFVSLGTTVNEELQTIIKACDMTGEAHEQYHIVLHAMLKTSKQMKKGESTDLENLKYCTYTYFEYFEL